MVDSGYDLFVSYAKSDRAWVEAFLIPALGLPDERMITADDFIPGRSILTEFERAVECSRYALIVFSPAYLADDWAVFGEQLAGFASVAEQSNRLIPLLLRPCDLPLHAGFRVQIDCTAEDDWPRAAARLRSLLNLPEPQPQAIPCPYPGMLPFSEGDAARFYGREDEVAEITNRLRYHNFLMIIGPSGSGKSSLVSAGLLPALQDRQPGRWAIQRIRPGATPTAALTEATQPLANAPSTQGAGSPRLLLVIDPLEEVFSLPTPAEREAAIQQIQQLRQVGACTLLLVMRSDFYTDLINSALWPVDPAQRFEVSPLRGEALRRAIEIPATRVGVFLEADLINQLVEDAAGEPGALPLMQETLALLWERREQRLLPLSAYQKLGAGAPNGLTHAITIMADAAYAGLLPAQQTTARRIFLRLVQFGEGRADTRRQQPTSKLAVTMLAETTEADRQEAQVVIQRLAGCRLLTLTGEEDSQEPSVDLAHEMLITAWPRFQEWIAGYKKAELTRRRLYARAGDWLQTSKRGGWLDAVELRSALAWQASAESDVVGVDETIQTFIDASRQANQAARRKSWLMPLAAVISVFLLCAIGWYSYAAAQRARAAALNPTVYIPGGTAMVGDSSQDLPLTAPILPVPIPPFDLESHEVSVDQYCLCIKSFGCERIPYLDSNNKEHDMCDGSIARYAVTHIRLSQASQFCNWMDGRLPTEMEWEWAARGKEERRYPTGDQDPIPGEVNLNNITVRDWIKEPWPVDRVEKDITPGYDPPGTLVGMAGNVREWTISWYVPYNPGAYLTTYWPEPLPGANNNVSTRGGSYLTPPISARSAGRINAEVSAQQPDLGFRCLMNLSEQKLREEVLSKP